eukprot:2813654-Rhodomonas_salina.3
MFACLGGVGGSMTPKGMGGMAAAGAVAGAGFDHEAIMNDLNASNEEAKEAKEEKEANASNEEAKGANEKNKKNEAAEQVAGTTTAGDLVLANDSADQTQASGVGFGSESPAGVGVGSPAQLEGTVMFSPESPNNQRTAV